MTDDEWLTCENGADMLWEAYKGAKRRALTLAACEIARTVRDLIVDKKLKALAQSCLTVAEKVAYNGDARRASERVWEYIDRCSPNEAEADAAAASALAAQSVSEPSDACRVSKYAAWASGDRSDAFRAHADIVRKHIPRRPR